jgi:hypothetical protein
MGKFVHGANGTFSGLVGPLVGSSWRGKPYLKSRPVRKKEVGEGELINRSNFGKSSQWLSPLKDYFRAGFKGPNPDFWAFQGAMSYMHAHAVIKIGKEKLVDPSKMLISQGDLPLGTDFDVYYDPATSEICVQWDPTVPPSRKPDVYASHTDKLMFAAYDVKAEEVYGEVCGASRRIGSDRFDIPSHRAVYHIYIAFVAADSSNRSDSIYWGTIEIDG